MWVIKKQNSTFISYLIILLSLFILFLVTYKQFEKLQVNLDMNFTLNTEKTELENDLAELEKLDNKLETDNTQIKKYLTGFSENEMIEYIYNYVENYNTETSIIYITDISMTQWVKNDLWFMQSNVNISANVSNLETMRRFLDFFVANNSKYNFIIDNFSFPNDSREWSFNINIPLKVFYN